MTKKTVLTKQMSQVMDLQMSFQDPEMGFFEGSNEQDWWRVVEGGVMRLGFEGQDKMSILIPAVDSGKRQALMEALQSRNASFRGMEVLVRRLGIHHITAPTKDVLTVPERKWAGWSPSEREAHRMEVASFFSDWMRRVLRSKRMLMSPSFPSVWLAPGALESQGERVTMKLGVLGAKAVVEVGVPVSWPSLFRSQGEGAPPSSSSASLLRWDSALSGEGVPQVPGVHTAALTMPVPEVPPEKMIRIPNYQNPARTVFQLDGLTYEEEAGQGWTIQEGEGT